MNKKRERITAVEVLNWEKYNHRPDVKNPTWFRLNIDWDEDPKFENLPPATTLVWLKCVAKSTKLMARVCPMSAISRAVVCRKDALKLHLKRLEIAGLVKLHVTCASEKKPLHNKTGQDITRQDIVSPKGDKSFRENDASILEFKKSSKKNFEMPILAKLWNEHCGDLPKVKKCSAKRLRHARSRFREEPDENFWVEVIQKISSLPFMNGDNQRGWRASFDFLIRPDTATKVSEGIYDAQNTPNFKPSGALNKSRTQRVYEHNKALYEAIERGEVKI